MGCIEIFDNIVIQLRPILFNRNMGCIEMHLQALPYHRICGLIETWDVLKSGYRDLCTAGNRV